MMSPISGFLLPRHPCPYYFPRLLFPSEQVCLEGCPLRIEPFLPNKKTEAMNNPPGANLLFHNKEMTSKAVYFVVLS